MGPFKRVHSLGTIPVLDDKGQTIDTVQVSGRMVLPLSIVKPRAVSRNSELQTSDNYYLSFALGELAYLHEQIPVS